MHPLEKIINESEGFIVIGNSAEDRFPGVSYKAYTVAKKKFYVYDMGGLTESRGPEKGGKIYTSIADIPEDHDDLAIIWVKPETSKEAVDLANEAGCKRIWFSFKTGTPESVAHARELGMEVVEIGRCPVYYLDGKPIGCAMHTAITKISGSYKRPPQTDPDAERREVW